MTTASCSHHEVLLQRRPGVHDRNRGHSVQRLQGDDLPRELGEAALHGALRGEEYVKVTVRSALAVSRKAAHLSGGAQRADRRHDVDRLDPPRLPLLVQSVRPLHDLLTVGVEHALQQRRLLITCLNPSRGQRSECEPTLTSSARLKRFCCRSLMYSDFTLLFQQAGPLSERFPVSTMIALRTHTHTHTAHIY